MRSPGKKRALAHRILGAKSAPTQSRRLREVLAHLRGETDLRIGGAKRPIHADRKSAGERP